MSEQRTFVLGDVHGAHKALLQVFERAGFDYENDRLIFLGDICDAWPQTRECIDELLQVKNLTALLGNHDGWFREWVFGGHPGDVWHEQGGSATIKSYGGGRDNVPQSHWNYLHRAKIWHEEDGRIFVHGGWDTVYSPHPMLEPALDVIWDRSLWEEAVERQAGGRPAPITMFSEVFIGHTTTTRYGFTEPAHCCEVWNLDQGAGWEGKLSLMNVDTKEFVQSDLVTELYPGVRGR